MRRVNTEVKKDVQSDLYGLGGMDMITLAGAHIIADAVDRLTEAVLALSKELKSELCITKVEDSERLLGVGFFDDGEESKHLVSRKKARQTSA